MSLSGIDTIVEDVLSGDINKYEDIVEMFQQDVWKVVAGARFDHDTASDLVHQTFVNAYQRLTQYRQGTHFVFWIKQIARNLVRKKMREMACRSKHQNFYRDSLDALLGSDERTEYEDTRAKALRACLPKLSKRNLQVFQFKYDALFSLKKIAQMMNETENGIKQRLWRSRLALRNCVETRMDES